MRSAATVRVVVVVVAYGDPAHLRRCLEGLGAPDGTVTVVDNGLSDEVRNLCRHVGAGYVRPSTNLGFAAGVNAGLEAQSGHPDVLLLNPDAVLAWNDVLRLQQSLRADARRAAVTPRLVRPSGDPEPPSWPVPSPMAVWVDAVGLSRWHHHGRRFLTGAVLLLRAESLAEIGGFDERFFLYAEESDWQLRALKAGWTVEIVEDVVAVHVGGATSSSATVRSEHFHRSARLFALKWYGVRGAAAMRAGSVAAALRRSLTAGRAGRAEARETLRIHLRRVS